MISLPKRGKSAEELPATQASVPIGMQNQKRKGSTMNFSFLVKMCYKFIFRAIIIY
jgi:hypothetical protein